MNKEEVIDSLQGAWVDEKANVQILIEGKEITIIDSNKETHTQFDVSYNEQTENWRISCPKYLWYNEDLKFTINTIGIISWGVLLGDSKSALRVYEFHRKK